MAAADTLALVAPELAPHANLTGAINLATSQVDVDALGSQAETAIAYLAAHILTIANRGEASGASGVAASGPVSSVSTGGLSVAFGSAPATSGPWWLSDLHATPYGRAYARIVESTEAGLGFWAV